MVVESSGVLAVVDLPEARFHWFSLPRLSQFVAVSPGLDEVSWYAFDPSSGSDELHVTTSAGDQVVAALPSSEPGRCGSPEDSKFGAYTESGSGLFFLDEQDPGLGGLVVLQAGRVLLRLAPDSGGKWALATRPAMVVWSPTSETLYYRHQGDVWTWTATGGARRFLPGVAWYYPTIAPDGRHLAYAVLRSEGLHDVYLVDLSTGGSPRKIGAGARNQPVFLTSSLLWFKTEGQGVCGPSGDKSLIYDLSDSSETPSAIGQLRAVWPATSSNH